MVETIKITSNHVILVTKIIVYVQDYSPDGNNHPILISKVTSRRLYELILLLLSQLFYPLLGHN